MLIFTNAIANDSFREIDAIISREKSIYNFLII